MLLWHNYFSSFRCLYFEKEYKFLPLRDKAPFDLGFFQDAYLDVNLPRKVKFFY